MVVRVILSVCRCMVIIYIFPFRYIRVNAGYGKNLESNCNELRMLGLACLLCA